MYQFESFTEQTKTRDILISKNPFSENHLTIEFELIRGFGKRVKNYSKHTHNYYE